jgi:mannose-6-phosphate isomerase-like protein (cupin superfamily)
LRRLAEAYGIGLMDILPPSHAIPEVVRADERQPLRSLTEGMSIYLLAPDASHAMTPVLGRLEPGAAEAEFADHGNEQTFIHVIQGALKIIFESGRIVLLRSGDSIYLEGTGRRKSENASRGVTITIGVTTWARR